jgi:preprotein translocase subunit YajC
MEMFMTILPLLFMFAIFYFLLIRPQQKQRKKIQEMHAALAKGDKIVTIGGLHGTIDAIDENIVVLLVNDNKKLTFDRNAVREVVNPDKRQNEKKQASSKWLSAFFTIIVYFSYTIRLFRTTLTPKIPPTIAANIKPPWNKYCCVVKVVL